MYIIIRTDETIHDVVAKLLTLRYRFQDQASMLEQVMSGYVIGDVEDIQHTVDTMIENMDEIIVIVKKESEE